MYTGICDNIYLHVHASARTPRFATFVSMKASDDHEDCNSHCYCAIVTYTHTHRHEMTTNVCVNEDAE